MDVFFINLAIKQKNFGISITWRKIIEIFIQFSYSKVYENSMADNMKTRISMKITFEFHGNCEKTLSQWFSQSFHWYHTQTFSPSARTNPTGGTSLRSWKIPAKTGTCRKAPGGHRKLLEAFPLKIALLCISLYQRNTNLDLLWWFSSVHGLG